MKTSNLDSDIIRAAFAGDVMIGRGVNSVISQKGYTYPWGNVLALLQSSDVNIINLETTLTKSQRKVDKIFNFKAAPDRIKTLEEGNISVVNISNNHILDFSEEGLIETLETLDAAGIKHTGAGIDADQAARPAMITCKNLRLGILGFTDNESTWKATATHGGTNYINVYSKKDRANACSLITQLRATVDIVIVSIHWGYNMQEEPPGAFIQFAHEMIDHGADLIHGHSAHIFQGIEVYDHKIILYDTGDFIDDYAVDGALRNDHSFLFMTDLGANGIERLKLYPVVIDNYQVNLAENEEYEWCIKRMQRLSDKFETKVKDDGQVVLFPDRLSNHEGM